MSKLVQLNKNFDKSTKLGDGGKLLVPIGPDCDTSCNIMNINPNI